MKFYSQNGEDKWIEEHWSELGLPDIGTFVDVGASNGVDLSNTKWLEDKGWRGLCIEPHPLSFAELYHNRTCAISNAAVGSEEGFADFVCHRIPDWSGFRRTGGVKIKVFKNRLDELLDVHGFVRVHVLSIDTEGTEIDVLNSVSLDRVNVLIVEHDTAEIGSTKGALMERLSPEFNLLETFRYNFIFQRKR